MKTGYKLALPQTEAWDRVWVWELINVGSGRLSPMAKGTMDTTNEASVGREQLSCRARRYGNAPRITGQALAGRTDWH